MINENIGKTDLDIEEIHRYKITSTYTEDDKEKSLINTLDFLDPLKHTYDAVIDYYKDKPNHIIISIFDYDKNTNIYYHDSEQERC